ncbi:MAG: hypothetical protein CMP49_03005 [Flavobacteriales bacterium]|jgi:cytochrome c-type biogenesis protein CcsB|nr:hypothetical protein [Flavobacteriales bacterium]|tara:strand:+ start:11288 stop:12988 length:1701 start_codon:yes stop_codon:yes gene_type:complete
MNYKFINFLFFTLLISFLSASNLPLDSLLMDRKIPKEHAELFSKILTQDNEGRIKPFNTFSSEILRKIARKDKLFNQNSDQIVIGMILDPLLWQMIPIIKVADEEVSTIINQQSDYVSFISFFSEKSQYLLTPYVEAAYAKRPIDRTKFDKKILEIDERVNICSMIFSDNLIRIFPSKSSLNAPWTPDVSMSVPGVDSLKTNSFKMIYRDLVYTSFSDGNWNSSNSIISFISNYQNEYAFSLLPSNIKVKLEIFYNKLKPFGWTRLFLFYFLVGFFLLFILLFEIFYNSNQIINRLSSFSKYLIFLGFIFHLLCLALRWYISGHAPWSNAYESVIFIAFATMLAGILFSKKTNFTLVAASIVAAMLLFVANLNWLNPEITNLVPVLKSYWLMIHVSVITSSYGFFGLCAFLGLLNLLLILANRTKKIESNISNLTIINEQSMMIGLFLLTIGTFLGGVWANESWGRYWGWDPKETWALVSCLVYALILHVRLLKTKKYIYFFNMLSLFGFSSILMTYFGVNYYLDGLHSYAAGDAFPVPDFVLPVFLSFLFISILSYFRFNKWINQ